MLLLKRHPLLPVVLLAASLVGVAVGQVAYERLNLQDAPDQTAEQTAPPAGDHPRWQPRKPTTQPIAEDKLQAMFDDLADADAAVRERAYSSLLGLTRADLPGLRKVVERSRPVAPSQAGLLRDVVNHVYLSAETYDCEPRNGFLGLVLPVLDSVEVPVPERQRVRVLAGERGDAAEREANQNTGVPVDHRVPGFCAFRALRAGDVVLGVIEPVRRPMRDWRQLTLTILAFPAGQEITLQVLRQGAVRNISLTLDARPLLANENVWTNQILPAREAAADRYWNEHFAPLVEERMSALR